MNRRAPAVVLLATMLLLVLGLGSAPAARADTCCANRAVQLEPRVAKPGDTVLLVGIVCLEADNGGPLALNPVEFWLSTDWVPAEDPGDTPGDPAVHLAADLPPAGHWHAFASVTGQGQAAAGNATIVVPRLADGKYQLWWRCDNDGGPGSGIHYSGGRRLIVGDGTPDTATEPAAPAAPAREPVPALPSALLWLGLGLGTVVVTLRRATR